MRSVLLKPRYLNDSPIGPIGLIKQSNKHTRTSERPRLEAILGSQVGQREDTACDEDGVDISVGVDVDEVFRCRCPWSRCQSRCHSRCQSSCRFPQTNKQTPTHFPRLLGSPSEIWESYDLNYHLPS